MDYEATKMWNEEIERELSPQHVIHFDEDTHTYTVDGEVKRSVTQILKDAGVCDYSGVDPYYADRGTRAHTACTLYAQGWDVDCDDDVIGYVDTFKSIVERLGLSYISAEEVCYDAEYYYCGKYDLIMMWEGKRVLVELKTGAVEMYHGLQIAAYERMVDVDTVMGISLKNGGKIFVPADDWHLNHEVWKDINTGWFVYEDWKVDRKRRRMNVLKEAA